MIGARTWKVFGYASCFIMEVEDKNTELSCIEKEIDALDIQIAKLQHYKRQLLERRESLLQSIRQEKISELESQDWEGKGFVHWLRPTFLNLSLKVV